MVRLEAPELAIFPLAFFGAIPLASFVEQLRFAKAVRLRFVYGADNVRFILTLFLTQTLNAQNAESRSPAAGTPISSHVRGTDGWDTEDWGSLEEEPVS